MNDIDFDELDKAVNSIVSKKSGAPSSQPSSSQPVESSQPTPAPQSAAPADPSDQLEVKTTSPNPAASTHVHVTPSVTPGRRGGRIAAPKPTTGAARGSFIDIMAPKPAAKPSRTGQTIQPVNPQPIKPETPMTEEPKTPEPPKETIKFTPPESAKLAEEKPKAEKSDDAWPDPLDFHDQDKTADPGNESITELEEPAKKTEPVPASPFIEGAKVEKRPLGAFTQYVAAAGKFSKKPDPAPEEPEKATSSEPTLEPSEDLSEMPDNNIKATPLPDELSPDVVAVEADEKRATATEQPAEDDTDQAPETEVVTEHEQPTRQQLHDTAMLSIPKQYKTAEKPTDSATRPVFDTKEYHPPLIEATAHAAHRGSIWGKLFMALLIIALLAVGGYFAFIYFIENF